MDKLYPGQLTTDEFIERARARHGDAYDYSQTDYINYRTKVCVICPVHGAWWVWPSNHTRTGANGCPACANESRSKLMTGRKGTSRPHTREQFIERAQGVHGGRYDYSRVDYRNSTTKIEIVCLDHGSFWQWPQNHLTGHNCPVCMSEQSKTRTLSTDEFIERARARHGSRYDYSKTVYTNMQSKVEIVCSVHGAFWQRALNHVRGNGCPACARLTITGRPRKDR